VVEARAQEYVVLVYDALKNNNEEALKKAEVQIDEYVRNLSKEEQTIFFQAFEKAYGELLTTGTITKVVVPPSEEPTTSFVESAKQKIDHAISTGVSKAEEAIVTGTERVKGAVESGTAKAKEAAAKVSAVAEEAKSAVSNVVEDAAALLGL
jgi:hypothetical protein